MKARLCLVAFVVLPFAVVVAGCGGGSGVTSGDVPTDVEQKYRIDFGSNTVSVIDEPLDGAAMVDNRPGASGPVLWLTLTVRGSDTGNPGERYVEGKVKNNGPVDIGVSPDGVASGVDLVLTSLRFEDGGGSRIDGGGMGGYYSVNPLTDLPVYRIAEKVARSATSSPVTLEFALPKNATTAVVGIAVRADSSSASRPTPSDQFLTTIAGRPGRSGFVNGPTSSAQFGDICALLARPTTGDVLVADIGNSVIRRIADGTVSTFEAGFTSSLENIAEDPDGNVVVVCYRSYRVYLVPAKGGTPSVIAGTGSYGDVGGNGTVAQFGSTVGLATLGDDIYVADWSADKLKKITYDGDGSRFSAGNYNVTTVLSMTGNMDSLAFNHRGDLFIGRRTPAEIHIVPAGTTTAHHIAGTGALGSTDGRGDVATLGDICDFAVDETGMLYFAEIRGNLRRVRHLGGDITQPTRYKVETLLADSAASTDGPYGTVADLLAVDVARDGTVWLAEEESVRRLDRRIH